MKQKTILIIMILSIILAINIGCRKKEVAVTSPIMTPTPTPILVIKIAGGGWHSLALKSDGSVWATGHNYYGQLGTGDNNDRNQWTRVY